MNRWAVSQEGSSSVFELLQELLEMTALDFCQKSTTAKALPCLKASKFRFQAKEPIIHSIQKEFRRHLGDQRSQYISEVQCLGIRFFKKSTCNGKSKREPFRKGCRVPGWHVGCWTESITEGIWQPVRLSELTRMQSFFFFFHSYF